MSAESLSLAFTNLEIAFGSVEAAVISKAIGWYDVEDT